MTKDKSNNDETKLDSDDTSSSKDASQDVASNNQAKPESATSTPPKKDAPTPNSATKSEHDPATGAKHEPTTSDAAQASPPEKSGKEAAPTLSPDDDKQVTFKSHPLLDRNKNRKRNFKGAKGSSTDPFSMILTQHQEHKWRIAKITGVVFAVALAVVVLFLAFDYWRRESDRRGRLERVEKRLEELDRKITETDGHAKNAAALAATRWTDAARRLDPENAKKWLIRKHGYIDVIAGGRPTPTEDFVNSRALFDMAYVPKGRFTIGKPLQERGSLDESPRHPVIISDEFWIGKTEISTAQYRMIYPNFRAEPWNGYELDKGSQPVINVNWHEAMKFCEYLTEWDRELGVLPPGYIYRLPTEAEWEYACRAGTSTAYYWGDEFKKSGAEFANSLDLRTAKKFDWREAPNMAAWDGHEVSTPVGRYKPNAFGLFDTVGNVWEWCLDWYNPKAYSELPHVDPLQRDPVTSKLVKRKLFDAGKYSIESTSRVIRGGSWGNAPNDLRSANRDSMIPEEKNTGVGFRVVLAKKPPVPEK